MLANAMRLVGMGWYIAITILLGVLGGNWVDQQLGTAPVFLLLGLGLGLAASFYGLFKMLLPLLSSSKDEDT
jgi:F0F1-type ATP synthase assembly protein I